MNEEITLDGKEKVYFPVSVFTHHGTLYHIVLKGDTEPQRFLIVFYKDAKWRVLFETTEDLKAALCGPGITISFEEDKDFNILSVSVRAKTPEEAANGH